MQNYSGKTRIFLKKNRIDLDVNFSSLFYLMVSFGLILIVFSANDSLANSKSSSVFSIDFETGLSAKTDSGTVEPTIIGSPQIVKGLNGNGIMVGGDAGFLRFDSGKLLNKSEGAISLWIKAEGWDLHSEGYHVFFDARLKNGAIFLYKFATAPKLLFLTTQDPNKGPHSITESTKGWREGKWQHLVGQWSKNRLDLYVNGRLVSSLPLPQNLPQEMEGYFSIGDLAWNAAQTGRTIIDDVVIYNRRLLPEEIASIFQKNNGTAPIANSLLLESKIQTRPPPVPWPKVMVANKKIFANEKVFSADTSIFLDQLNTNKKNLFFKPISLEIEGFQLREINNRQLAVSSHGEVATETKNLLYSNINHSISFNLTSSFHFDGLVQFDIKSECLPPSLIGESLTYTIYLNKKMVRFLHKPGEVGKRNFDLKSQPFGRMDSKYVPFIWLGNDLQGLFWFCESSAGWGNAREANAVVLKENQEFWELKINIKPVSSSNGSWNHKFGIMPTPTKQLPKGWRKLRMFPAENHNAYVVWPNESQASFPYFGYPFSNNPPTFRGYVSTLKKKGVVAAPYVCPTWMSIDHPEWRVHKSEWAAGAAEPTFKNVCSNRESWRSLINRDTARFINDYNLEGIYLDNAQTYASYQCLAEGYSPNAIEYPLIPQRDIYQKIWETLLNNTNSPLMVAHSSGGVNAMSFSLANAWVNGEQYREIVDEDYMEVVSLTDFRVELNGKQWGFIPLFLPEFNTVNRKKTAPTRKLMAILLLHDAIPWPFWANKEEIDKGLHILSKFDVSEAEFIAYYDEYSFVEETQEGIYVSYYSKVDRNLLIVSNLSNIIKREKICLKKTDDFLYKFFTFPEVDEINSLQNCIELEIGPGEYRAILVKK